MRCRFFDSFLQELNSTNPHKCSAWKQSLLYADTNHRSGSRTAFSLVLCCVVILCEQDKVLM